MKTTTSKRPWALTPYEKAVKLGLIGCVSGPRNLAANRKKYLKAALRAKRPA